MRKTRIIVLQLKEIIYTALFVAFGIFLIILLVFMFTNKKEDSSPTTATYTPGIYTSSVVLNNQPVNVEVTVDRNHINSIRITNLDNAVETMYPLLVPTLSNLENQLINDTPINNLSIQTDSMHTSSLLLNAIESALDKANPTKIHNDTDDDDDNDDDDHNNDDAMDNNADANKGDTKQK